MASYLTDEFGVPLATEGAADQPLQYTGEQRDDESGLVYLRARTYEPSVGRFTSRDTVFGQTELPPSLHRFTYVQNNPVTLTDPSGLVIKNVVLSDDNEIVVILGISTNPLAGAGLAAVTLARNLGNLGETAAKIVKNSERIASVTEKAKYRIPDILDRPGQVVGDVKNVSYLRLSSQLKDTLAFAEKYEFTMVLKVRNNTVLSQGLQELEKQGRITVERVLPNR